MSNSVLALIVAIVGVVGTLTAAVLTQLFAVRAQRDQRREESWRTTLKERRDSCVALNVEARRFQQTLRSCSFETTDSKKMAELEQAWQAYISCYTQARIILPQNVVEAASRAFAWLRRTYEALQAGPSLDEQDKLRDRIDNGEVVDAIRQLREASREALGSDLPIRPPKGLLQLSSQLQGRTFDAPGRAAMPVPAGCAGVHGEVLNERECRALRPGVMGTLAAGGRQPGPLPLAR